MSPSSKSGSPDAATRPMMPSPRRMQWPMMCGGRSTPATMTSVSPSSCSKASDPLAALKPLVVCSSMRRCTSVGPSCAMTAPSRNSASTQEKAICSLSICIHFLVNSRLFHRRRSAGTVPQRIPCMHASAIRQRRPSLHAYMHFQHSTNQPLEHLNFFYYLLDEDVSIRQQKDAVLRHQIPRQHHVVFQLTRFQ